jgi:two-component system LytT family response regulator
VFLDVQLPGRSGLDVLRAATHRPAVIFTTAFDHFALAAFELGAIDYLLKPFGMERFQRAVERAKPFLQQRQEVPAAARAEDVMQAGPLRRVFVRDGLRVVPLAVSAIEHVEACDDFVLVRSAGKTYRLNITMTDLEERLDPKTFVRVHRSHVVNLDHVQSMAPYDGSRFQLTLRNGTTLVASRQRSRVLRQPGR